MIFRSVACDGDGHPVMIAVVTIMRMLSPKLVVVLTRFGVVAVTTVMAFNIFKTVDSVSRYWITVRAIVVEAKLSMMGPRP